MQIIGTETRTTYRCVAKVQLTQRQIDTVRIIAKENEALATMYVRDAFPNISVLDAKKIKDDLT